MSLKEWQEPNLSGKYQQLGINRDPEAAVASAVSLSHCSCKCDRMLVPDERKHSAGDTDTQSAAGASA